MNQKELWVDSITIVKENKMQEINHDGTKSKPVLLKSKKQIDEALKKPEVKEVRVFKVHMKTNANGWCPCGSGKRYKDCCLPGDVDAASK